MKIWLPRLWFALLLVLFAVSVPQCLNIGNEHSLINWSGKQSAFDPQGPLARQQLDTFYVTLWVTGFLMLTVGGAFAFALWRFRLKKGDDPNFIPKQSHGHPLIEVGLVAVSAALLVIIAIPTFAGILKMKVVPAKYDDANSIDVTVTGYQWWFNFEYPEEGIYAANELVFPANRTVRLNLITEDVNHSFWIPKLSGKTDLIAGQENFMWIRADEPGYFWGQCAEYCGDSHAYMLFRARAVTDEEYEQWLRDQKSATVRADGSFTPLTIPEESDPDLVMQGVSLFQDHCARCHDVDPTLQRLGAPNLAHFASRTSIAAGWLENEWDGPADNPALFRWLKQPDSVKPGNNMWRGFIQDDGTSVQMEGLKDANLSDADVRALIAYLYTLRAAEVPAGKTPTATDLARGN